MTRIRAAPFHRLIDTESRNVEVRRRDSTTSPNYGEEITYSELPEKREVFVAGISESEQPTDAGEWQAMRLILYTNDDVDLQVNDRIPHGEVNGFGDDFGDAFGTDNAAIFEVESKAGKPNDLNPVVYRYELDNVSQ